MVFGLREAWDAGILRLVETNSANEGKFAQALSWIRIKILPNSESISNKRETFLMLIAF